MPGPDLGSEVLHLQGPELVFLNKRDHRHSTPGGDGVEVYSEKSPLGEAINGRHKGESTTYTAPNGNTVPVEILDTEPFAG